MIKIKQNKSNSYFNLISQNIEKLKKSSNNNNSVNEKEIMSLKIAITIKQIWLIKIASRTINKSDNTGRQKHTKC